MATKLTPLFILWQPGLKWTEQNQLVSMTRNVNSNEKVMRLALINCIIMQCQSCSKSTDFVHYRTVCFTFIIKCRMRTNVFRKGNWKQLPTYLGKKYIVDVFVQNEEQFKICGALKIIKQSSVSHLCKAQSVVWIWWRLQDSWLIFTYISFQLTLG